MKYFAIIKYDIEDNNRKCSTNVFFLKNKKITIQHQPTSQTKLQKFYA